MVHCKIYLFWNIFVKNNKHIQIRVCCGQHHGVNIWFESDEYLMDILSDLNQKVVNPPQIDNFCGTNVHLHKSAALCGLEN